VGGAGVAVSVGGTIETNVAVSTTGA